MRYSFWMHDTKIGESDFELPVSGRRLAGTFHPTLEGLTVLPRITAMLGAVLDFGELCIRLGYDMEDGSKATATAALETLAETPEGKRLSYAAKHVAAVDVRDASGEMILWESLAITDIRELPALAAKIRRNDDVAPVVAPSNDSDSPRYLVSLTRAVGAQRYSAGPEHFRSKHRQSPPN